MAVTFECTSRTTIGMTELFDLSRSIDAHKDSMARSREQAVGGCLDEFAEVARQDEFLRHASQSPNGNATST